MTVSRIFYNVACSDLERSHRFYAGWLGLVPEFVSEWFVHLRPAGAEGPELGLLRRDHAVVPPAARAHGAAGLLTFVVDDVDRLAASAAEHGGTVLDPPTDQFYGQRRLLVCDPDGTVVDVSSECPPDPKWLRRVRPRAGGGYAEDPDSA
jgi:catechol 2,3-dioxygenase-like lactoylglutathione lyase family enzyme